MIELKALHKQFGKQVVLDRVDFEVREGETVALLGPSGTGKSVLLKHIIGLIKPDQGTVLVDGKDVSRLNRKDLSELRSRIGYVFQNGALFDSMNVFENVRLGITDEAKYADLDYCRERIAECIRLVNLLPETIEKYPAQLSGGMRKRVGIARAIAGAPKYLLYDEPTSGLDPVNADIIDSLVERLDDDPRCPGCLPGRRQVGPSERGCHRHARYPEGISGFVELQGPGVPRARFRQPLVRGLSRLWICATPGKPQ
jgi:phospholipid/cholesterol/gamma-HCH transport system ATP-binding protein